MKQTRFSKFLAIAFFGVIFFGSVAVAASIGAIDPTGAGNYKAAFLDNSVVADPAINFGKFTTESQYNITVSSSELRGYAWGSSVGWIVTNCADTTSGCSNTNGNFKIANDGTGKLSGYAWGENTGWINFGPFTDPSISKVKIGATGDFGGTSGSAGYAWSQNYGWIVFDCTNPATCVNTDWRAASAPSGGGGGTTGGTSGGSSNGGSTGTGNTPTVTVEAVGLVCDSIAALPHWGNGAPAITAATVPNYLANSKGHCRFVTDQSFQWGTQSTPYTSLLYGPSPLYTNFPQSTNTSGYTIATIPLTPTTTMLHLREVLKQANTIFSYPVTNNNSNPVSAEFYCGTGGQNYDNDEFINNPQPGATYYCVAFNTHVGAPATSPTSPTTPPVTPPNTPPTNSTTPPAGSTTPPTGTTTTPSGNGNGSNGNSGNGGTGNQPGGTSNQPGGNNTAGGDQPNQAPTGSETSPTGSPAQSTTEPGPFANGLILPSTFVEAANNVLKSLGGAVNDLSRLFGPVATGVMSAARSSVGKAVTTATTALGIVTTVAAGAALLLLANPASLPELVSLPVRLWNLLLVSFGFKKRNRPWGTVYDSVTKQPIDPAYVVLMAMNGTEVATSITDIDGRYGFAVAAGTYKIVVNKTNYQFPSQKLAGKTADELYANLYYGETITTTEDSEVIIKNIPMDQLNFDWNEFAKNEQHRLSYYRRSDLTIARLSNFFFWLGFVVSAIALLSSHTVYNGIVFILYIIMFLVRHYSPQFKPQGSIASAITDEPLPFAILHVLSISTGQEITHKVADRLGNFYCLVPNGTYRIVIDRKNPDASYTKMPVAESVTVTEGYLKHDFKI